MEQHGCLTDAGFEVSNPPTFQAFADAFSARGDTRFYYPIGELQGDESVAADLECPLAVF